MATHDRSDVETQLRWTATRMLSPSSPSSPSSRPSPSSVTGTAAAGRPSPAVLAPWSVIRPIRSGLDHISLYGGTIATAIVTSLVATLGVIAGRALLGVEIIAPRGGRMFADASAYQLTVSAAAGAIVAAALAYCLMYVTPRPLLFLGLMSYLATAVLTLWPFTTAAGVLTKIASSLVYLAIGITIAYLTTTVARHAGIE